MRRSEPAPPEILKLAVDGYNEMQHLLVRGGPRPKSSPTNPRLSFRLAQDVPDLALRQLLLSTRSEAERLRHLAGFFPGVSAEAAAHPAGAGPGAAQRPRKTARNETAREMSFLLIDADDTLWENNIYFESAFDDFVEFLDHSSLNAVANPRSIE